MFRTKSDILKRETPFFFHFERSYQLKHSVKVLNFRMMFPLCFNDYEVHCEGIKINTHLWRNNDIPTAIHRHANSAIIYTLQLMRGT